MELSYLKVRWLHDDPAYPVLLLSELDERRYEVRKAEIYADGRIDIAYLNRWIARPPSLMVILLEH